MTIYSLEYFFSYLEPVCCSMSSSNCCFLTCIQVSQESGQVVWYSHLFKNFPVCCERRAGQKGCRYLAPDHLICLLRNLYAGQEAIVRTGHGTTDWLQIRKGVCQGCILSPCLFNLYAEYIMRNAGLDEAQAGIKIAGRNINTLRYADDTSLTAESKRN